MSDEQSLEDNELQELARSGKNRYALPIPFGAVDAALWQFLGAAYHIQGTVVQRQSITSGSVRYRLLVRDHKQHIGSFHAQMINEVVTVVDIEAGTLINQANAEARDILSGLLIHMLDHFVPWLANKHDQAVEEAEAFVKTEPSESTSPPSLPKELIPTHEPPQPSDPVDAWLDWREDERKRGHRLTLAQLADQSNWSEGTLKKYSASRKKPHDRQ
jgi:hypothetical protein